VLILREWAFRRDRRRLGMNQQDAPGLKNDCPEQLLDARHEGTSSWGRAEQTPLNSAMFPRYNILASGGLEMMTFTKSPTETRPMHRCQSRTLRSEESIATAGAYADLTRRVRRAFEHLAPKRSLIPVKSVERSDLVAQAAGFATSGLDGSSVRPEAATSSCSRSSRRSHSRA
jgi:hypothetical protein